MEKDTIFIHIPKTGGTTINTAINNSYWQTEVNFFYRHIQVKTKTSTAGDIFDPKNIEQYKKYNIFMMLRHPIDRVTSEYYFIQERKNFIKLLTKKPQDFNDYIKNYQTHNGVVNFLKGRRFFDTKSATEDDLNDIINSIEKIPIHVGIFEDFAASLTYFSKECNLNWNKEIEIKRMTFKRPKTNELSEETKALILENNQLDLKLYEYCLKKFENIKHNLKENNIQFKKDKYTHVIPYAVSMCLFEFCMTNKKFIKQNLNFFNQLTTFIIAQKKVTDGLVFTKSWNETFLNAISYYYPESDLYNALKKDYNPENDALDETYKLAMVVDEFFTNSSLITHKYYTPMDFKGFLVIIPEVVKEEKKKGFFSQLFKK
ncbi:MAG: sulfotransferase family 2 domain-containing protein [Flavobacteriales bacterium]